MFLANSTHIRTAFYLVSTFASVNGTYILNCKPFYFTLIEYTCLGGENDRIYYPFVSNMFVCSINLCWHMIEVCIVVKFLQGILYCLYAPYHQIITSCICKITQTPHFCWCLIKRSFLIAMYFSIFLILLILSLNSTKFKLFFKHL